MTDKVWIKLAEVGTFRGHPSGPFELTAKTFDEICANFTRAGLLVPIDAEHASEMPASEGSIPSQGAPAMGWIHELQNRGDAGLWGLVEWLEPAKSYIKEGRYKYLSPAIRFGARDTVTGAPVGAKLSSAAITNTPFLRHLGTLAAKDSATAPDAIVLEKMTAEEVTASRTVSMSASFADILDLVEDLIDIAMDKHLIEFHGGEGPHEEGTEAGLADDGECQMSDTELTDVVTETPEAVQLKEATARATTLEAELVTLRAWKAEREDADLRAEVDVAFATYKDARRLSEDVKPHMLTLAKAAPEAFRGMYPRIEPDKRHLLTDVAVARVADSREVAPTMGILELADKYQSERKGLSREDALCLAEKDLRRARAAAR